ncbi:MULTISPECIES: Rmf/CrpP fold protein [Streptomyces]|uniref:Rmf/CrpP fold protein n=1 Tax=Streptomyces TaxID=1883 RepID=UPI0018FE4A45|nr:Rmf/CrpP fold protein [Streptomyces sp. CB02120-2]
MGTRADIVRAVTEGAEAGRTGQEPTTCPYPRTSVLRTAWIKGYAPARRQREQAAAD